MILVYISDALVAEVHSAKVVGMAGEARKKKKIVSIAFSHFKSLTIGSKIHKNGWTVLRFNPHEQFYATFQKIV